LAERDGAGAPIGNRNNRKGRLFGDAIEAALKLQSRSGAKARIDVIADKIVSMAEEGDMAAIRELGDRIDGKVAQAITGADGGPMVVTIRHESA
jgi:hypothetical protein